MPQAETVLYTRREHGNIPVVVSRDLQSGRCSYRLQSEEPVEFDSTRSFLSHLYGTEKRGMTWARYFRIPKHTPALTIEPAFTPVTVVARAPCNVLRLGIDLAQRSPHGRKADEVRKLLFAGFGRRIMSRGYDPDDVLQVVYEGILVRNRGKCPFDARKSSFGHYVHMVCGCIVANYHKKQQRRASRETTGVAIVMHSQRVTVDVSDADMLGRAPLNAGRIVFDNHDGGSEDMATQSLYEYLDSVGPEGVWAKRILPMLREGHTRKHIAERTGMKPSQIKRAFRYLREQARTWAADEGLQFPA